jgi:sugar O-acyltransferase (sialic acid O-acetyltransferase NeuD family)
VDLSGLTIVGAGGHGRVVADIASTMGYSDIRFVDDRWPGLSRNLIWPVVGKSLVGFEKDHDVFVAVGDCGRRNQIVEDLVHTGWKLPVLKHDSAQISQHSHIGLGTVIMPQVCINVGSKLGLGVIANTSCSIDHDCILGNGVHVSPGAILAGGVKVGANSWIGAGAVVKEGIVIGDNCVIAAGAVVLANVAGGTRVAGVPARLLR